MENEMLANETLLSTLRVPKKIKQVRDSDIIPEDMQNKLMYWRDMFRVAQFDIGDDVAEIIESCARRGIDATHERIFSAVGRYCGKSSRTVRYYYETAIFYGAEARQEFDMLPFSHFVLARSFGVNGWREVLEYSTLYPSMSVDALKAVFLGDSVAVASRFAPGGEDFPDANENETQYSRNGHAKKNICGSSQDIAHGRCGMHVRIREFESYSRSLDELGDMLQSLGDTDDICRCLDAIVVLKRHLPRVVARLVVE